MDQLGLSHTQIKLSSDAMLQYLFSFWESFWEMVFCPAVFTWVLWLSTLRGKLKRRINRTNNTLWRLCNVWSKPLMTLWYSLLMKVVKIPHILVTMKVCWATSSLNLKAILHFGNFGDYILFNSTRNGVDTYRSYNCIVIHFLQVARQARNFPLTLLFMLISVWSYTYISYNSWQIICEF